METKLQIGSDLIFLQSVATAGESIADDGYVSQMTEDLRSGDAFAKSDTVIETGKEESENDELLTSFWRRQFQGRPTSGQTKFDWLFGIVMPLICVAADPIVFRGSFDGSAILGDYKIFAYALSSASVLALAAWLLWGRRLGELVPFLGGFFLAGSLVALAVGIVLFPFSLVGLLILIGVLGFTPLLSSFVFLRNGVRAIRESSSDAPRSYIWGASVIAALYALVVPFVLNR